VGAYPLKLDKSKAKAAYAELAPDIDLHARLVDAGTRLAHHYAENATERKWQKRLHRWLIEERYDEEPLAYVDAKEAAIATRATSGPRKAKGDAAPQAGKATGPSGAPLGRYVVRVVRGEQVTYAGEHSIKLRYRIEGGEHHGKEFDHGFVYRTDEESDDGTKGQAMLNNITTASGVNPPDATGFNGLTMVAKVTKGGAIEYVPGGTSAQEKAAGLSYGTPLGSHTVKIIDSDFKDDGKGEKKIGFDYLIQGGEYDGREFHHEFYLADAYCGSIKEGEKLFADIRQATGVMPRDTVELHDKTLVVTVTEHNCFRFNVEYAALT
jgi:hypothetical protein